MSKHDAMVEYLNPHIREIAGQVLRFNANTDEQGSYAFATEYGEKEVKRYLSGAVKRYGFIIKVIAPYSHGVDQVNVDAMNMAQSFLEWVETQNDVKNFPNFGERCTVQRIEALQDMPALAAVYTNGTAEYQLHCRVEYYEERGRMS